MDTIPLLLFTSQLRIEPLLLARLCSGLHFLFSDESLHRFLRVVILLLPNSESLQLVARLPLLQSLNLSLWMGSDVFARLAYCPTLTSLTCDNRHLGVGGIVPFLSNLRVLQMRRPQLHARGFSAFFQHDTVAWLKEITLED